MIDIEKVLQLAKKTGDRLIVLDSATGSAFSILPLEDYEKMITGVTNSRDLTEEELLSKINREISLWREAQQKVSPPPAVPVDRVDVSGEYQFEPVIDNEPSI